MKRFEVEFFDKADGTYPAEEFILSQENKMRAKIYRMLDLLAERGNELREPYSKPLEDGIFEIRVKQGSDITRVLYFFMEGNKIVLTNGFVKKTRKTPEREITLARKYRAEYISRKE